MSESEYKITDTRGKFLQAMKGGHKLRDAAWTSGRILLSNRRLILAGNGGKRTIPLSKINGMSGRYDVNQSVASVSDYISLEFEAKLYGAMLNQSMILVKHPAVKGGVVHNTDWERARVKVEVGEVGIAVASGIFIQLELDDIGQVDTAKRTVEGETRTVLEVEHSEGSTSVQTYISGKARRCSLLGSLFQKGEQPSVFG